MPGTQICRTCGGHTAGHPVACPACGHGPPVFDWMPAWVSLPLAWTLTLLTLIGPWMWLQRQNVPLETYLIGVIAYTLLCYGLTPSYDPGKLSYDAWSEEDDWHRNMRNLVLLLIPGKIVLWTFRATWDALGRLP